jgi:hypothetical protein
MFLLPREKKSNALTLKVELGYITREKIPMGIVKREERVDLTYRNTLSPDMI